MIVDTCQRWRERRASYRPAGEVIDPRAIPPEHDELLARFVARVAIIDDATSCWLWTGSRLPKGYGRFYPRWKVGLYAHRFSWECASGALVPVGLEILHSCDNPPCVRPDHLSPGTHAANVAEMHARGRAACAPLRGERHPHAKLTEEAVRSIRSSSDGPAALAARHGVSRELVKAVRARRIWRHVA